MNAGFIYIGVRAKFFCRGPSHLCPKNISTAPETWKIAWLDLPQPIIISKNPRFRALYFAGRNKFLCFFSVMIQLYKVEDSGPLRGSTCWKCRVLEWSGNTWCI